MDLFRKYSSESGSNSFSSESSLSASGSIEFPTVLDFDMNYIGIDNSPALGGSNESQGDNPPSTSMDELDRLLTPVLAQIMTLSPDNDHHADIKWLYKWLSQPERTVEEFKYIVGSLQQNICRIMTNLFEDYVYDYCDDGDIVYVLKIAAEALALRCPVLEGPWEKIAWRIFSPLGEWKNKEYGPASSILSNWIIRVIGDPHMCPSPELRIQMLRLYRNLVKIDKDNQKNALESLMFACSSLKRRGDDFFIAGKSSDFTELLMMFTEDNDYYYDEDDEDEADNNDYIYQYGLIVAQKLKQHRYKRQNILLRDVTQEYCIGLKKLSQPIELHSLIALLVYISDEARAKEGFFISKQILVEMASDGLETLVKIFKEALQEPDLLGVTADCIMNVMEAAVIWAKEEQDEYKEDYELSEDELHCFYNIDSLLEEFCDDMGDDNFIEMTPVGMEIIRRYKGRICKMRSLMNKDFFESVPNVCGLIYNKDY